MICATIVRWVFVKTYDKEIGCLKSFSNVKTDIILAKEGHNFSDWSDDQEEKRPQADLELQDMAAKVREKRKGKSYRPEPANHLPTDAGEGNEDFQPPTERALISEPDQLEKQRFDVSPRKEKKTHQGKKGRKNIKKTVTFNENQDEDEHVFKPADVPDNAPIGKTTSRARHEDRFSNITQGNKMVSSIHESEKPQLMLPRVVDIQKAPKRYMSRPYEDESMMSDSLEFNAVIENEFWYNKQPEVLNRASLP